MTNTELWSFIKELKFSSDKWWTLLGESDHVGSSGGGGGPSRGLLINWTKSFAFKKDAGKKLNELNKRNWLPHKLS